MCNKSVLETFGFRAPNSVPDTQGIRKVIGNPETSLFLECLRTGRGSVRTGGPDLYSSVSNASTKALRTGRSRAVNPSKMGMGWSPTQTARPLNGQVVESGQHRPGLSSYLLASWPRSYQRRQTTQPLSCLFRQYCEKQVHLLDLSDLYGAPLHHIAVMYG